MGLRCLCVGCSVSSLHLAWRSETSSGGIHVNNRSLMLIYCDFGIAVLELGGSGRIFRHALAGVLAVGGTARAMSRAFLSASHGDTAIDPETAVMGT